jgi:hypothetical protein
MNSPTPELAFEIQNFVEKNSSKSQLSNVTKDFIVAVLQAAEKSAETHFRT